MNRFRPIAARLANTLCLALALTLAAPAAQARSVVSSDVPRGTILVDTSERRLYFGLGNGKAVRYRVAVGRAGKQWTGTARIRRKAWQPAWSPTAEIRRDNPRLPRVIPAGSPSNPMGLAALVLSKGTYAIHGTNRPGLIGRAVSYGCIRMKNGDIADLYDRVRWGTRVVVRR